MGYDSLRCSDVQSTTDDCTWEKASLKFVKRPNQISSLLPTDLAQQNDPQNQELFNYFIHWENDHQRTFEIQWKGSQSWYRSFWAILSTWTAVDFQGLCTAYNLCRFAWFTNVVNCLAESKQVNAEVYTSQVESWVLDLSTGECFVDLKMNIWTSMPCVFSHMREWMWVFWSQVVNIQGRYILLSEGELLCEEMWYVNKASTGVQNVLEWNIRREGVMRWSLRWGARWLKLRVGQLLRKMKRFHKREKSSVHFACCFQHFEGHEDS